MKRFHWMLILLILALVFSGCSEDGEIEADALPALETAMPQEYQEKSKGPFGSRPGHSYELGSGLWVLIHNDVMTISGNNAADQLKVTRELKENSWVLQRLAEIKTVKIESGVKAIGSNAFNDALFNGLEIIEIGDSVSTIEASAFAGCANLQRISLGGVKTIGTRAFEDCTALKTVSSAQQMESVGEYAFYGCNNLQDVPLGLMKQIGARAFEGCTALNQASLDQVETVGEYAFSGCTGMQTVIVGEAMGSLDWHAFSGCTALSTVRVRSDVPERLFEGCTSLKEVYLEGEHVTVIGERAFFGCTSLNKITIPKCVSRVDREAFSGCTALNQVKIEVEETGNLVFGDAVFANCEALREVDFPEGVTILGARIFENCESLTKVILPRSLTKIGEYAFNNCASLMGNNRVFYRGSGKDLFHKSIGWQLGSQIYESTITFNYKG